MPLYHFHTIANTRQPDTDGVDLPDDGAAQDLAVRYAGELLRDEPALVRDGRTCRVEVTTEGGSLIFTFTASTLAEPATPLR